MTVMAESKPSCATRRVKQRPDGMDVYGSDRSKQL